MSTPSTSSESDRLSAILQAVVATCEDVLAEVEPALLAAARGAIVAHLIASVTTQPAEARALAG